MQSASKTRARLWVLPAVILLLWPSVAIYSVWQPWARAIELLRDRHPANLCLLIGGSYDSVTIGSAKHVERSANYLLLPDSLKSGSTFSVRERDGKLGVEEHAYDLVITFAFYAAFGVATWFWRRASLTPKESTQ